MAHIISNRYEILDEIGQGGMGTVFRGTDRQTRQPVAIKQLKPDVSSTEIMERFQREGEILRQLHHPNIVNLLSTEAQDGQHYLVMEYIPGGDLRHLLKSGRLSVSRILVLALELADALSRAHHLGIIHRDLKPGNVLIAEDGTPRLTDFGIAHVEQQKHLTPNDMILGTVDYLAPEALQGEAVDARLDIWAFGVILFEMLTGQHPFARNTVSLVCNAILSDPLPSLDTLRPDCPIALVDLVYRMLEKDPNRRIPSIRLVGAEIEAILNGWQPLRSDKTPYIGLSVQPDGSNKIGQRFETPTPASTNHPRGNLPAQTTPFIGREAELTELAQLLDDPRVRLITIQGGRRYGQDAVGNRSGRQIPDPLYGWRVFCLTGSA